MGKKGENSEIIAINTKIYPLDVIYSAAYVMLDKCYIFLDGDAENTIKVAITSKDEKEKIEKIISEFKNQLINYAFYKKQSEKNCDIRQLILNTAISTKETVSEKEAEDASTELSSSFDNADFLDDPEGIAIPWEEKYGKSNKKAKTCKNEHRDKQR